MSDRIASVPAPAALVSLADQLKGWLSQYAYPLWWERGADHVRGGFHERIDQHGQGLAEPRRARLHPRQMFAFSLAGEFGHHDLAARAVEHALRFYLSHYQRPDGFFRTLVSAEGAAMREDFVLYDQAFSLFGLAAAYRTLGDDSIRRRAEDLLALVEARLAHSSGGYEETDPPASRLTANSHMHLLEAALGWIVASGDARWQELADQIVDLALHRFRAGDGVQIREFFVQGWVSAPDADGAFVEPGHQFEWAWLLMRWGELTNAPVAIEAVRSLIDTAEKRGVDPVRGVALNGLLADGTVRDARARLWPQTERLKAACAAARRFDSSSYWNMALQSAGALCKYLETPFPGLWYDVMGEDGTLQDEPAPASSFYHLAAAIRELDATTRELQPESRPVPDDSR